jgi:hypothetical protein
VALEEKALDHFADVEGGKLGFMRAEGEIFEIEKKRHRCVGIGRTHGVRMKAESIS